MLIKKNILPRKNRRSLKLTTDLHISPVFFYTCHSILIDVLNEHI